MGRADNLGVSVSSNSVGMNIAVQGWLYLDISEQSIITSFEM